jgi:hypothetical protein
MNKIPVAKNISFADARLISFERLQSRDLNFYISSWEEKIIKVAFKNAIHFSYNLGSIIHGLYELLESSSVLDAALNRKFEKIPLHHTFKHFQIEDIDEFAFIEVVAEAVIVEKE